MKRYVNRYDGQTRETVDELRRIDFPSRQAFNAEIRRLLGEYRLSDSSAEYYASNRACKGWNQ